jgi:hypothetical protein
VGVLRSTQEEYEKVLVGDVPHPMGSMELV